MEIIKIPIYATDEDARKFLLFQKYYDVFEIMLKAKVFDQKKATIILNFDHEGTLKSIQRQDYLFSDKLYK